jgi:hypothetical protein
VVSLRLSLGLCLCYRLSMHLRCVHLMSLLDSLLGCELGS